MRKSIFLMHCKIGEKMKKIAFYGKGGIGKSTTVSNVAATLTKKGYKVFQVGCDPKSDSTVMHNGGKRPATVLGCIRAGGGEDESEFLFRGTSGVFCMEAGGPQPGTGCAGRGIIAAFERISELNIYEKYSPDFVLFDVLGDVVCGGFAMPLRGGYADEVYIVTSGEMMSLYAAENIVRAVKNIGNPCRALLKGIIVNKKNIEKEEEKVAAAAEEMGVPVFFTLPRSIEVQKAEALGKTVVEAFPGSEMCAEYEKLAEKIAHG